MLTTEELTEKYGEDYLAAQALAGNLEKLMKNGAEMAQTANSWRDRMDTTSYRYGAFSKSLGARDWGVTVTENDRIISLVTCADNDTDVRFVVQAKLVSSKDRTKRLRQNRLRHSLLPCRKDLPKQLRNATEELLKRPAKHSQNLTR